MASNLLHSNSLIDKWTVFQQRQNPLYLRTPLLLTVALVCSAALVSILLLII